eukprot:3940846-Rhodomonas_salina.3
MSLREQPGSGSDSTEPGGPAGPGVRGYFTGIRCGVDSVWEANRQRMTRHRVPRNRTLPV